MNVGFGIPIGFVGGLAILLIVAGVMLSAAFRRRANQASLTPRRLDWTAGFTYWFGVLAACLAGTALLLRWLSAHPILADAEIDLALEAHLRKAVMIVTACALMPAVLAFLVGLFAVFVRGADPTRYGRLLALFGLMLALASSALVVAPALIQRPAAPAAPPESPLPPEASPAPAPPAGEEF